MVSQYTRDLIRKEAEARALENSKPKTEIIKSSEKIDVSEPVVKENLTTEKKTDAEKLKSKKKES